MAAASTHYLLTTPIKPASNASTHSPRLENRTQCITVGKYYNYRDKEIILSRGHLV